MLIHAYLVHALSPLHAGTGQSVDTIDLPIARTCSTGIPFVPGSSVKGVLRERSRSKDEGSRCQAVFGPDHTGASEHAGAFGAADARLLALPVRSFVGTFAWVSSPLLLTLARRDLADAQPGVALPEVVMPAGHAARITSTSRVVRERKLYLGELDLEAAASKEVDAWARWLAPMVTPGSDAFASRFVVVDDDTMAFLLETAMQIDARVRICHDTGTVADGALWYEESLPPETLLLGLAMADRSRREAVELSPAEVLDCAMPQPLTIQLGGKASVGRGRCRVVRIAPEGEGRAS
ncbi:MAG: type III-B CRISPR module RAMP protein Cmr4 [Myxococcales bacterium]|nr:type III-B CRISPR module RAMP protein Cmr4 [Myxococcales bacterium]